MTAPACATHETRTAHKIFRNTFRLLIIYFRSTSVFLGHVIHLLASLGYLMMRASARFEKQGRRLCSPRSSGKWSRIHLDKRSRNQLIILVGQLRQAELSSAAR